MVTSTYKKLKGSITQAKGHLAHMKYKKFHDKATNTTQVVLTPIKPDRGLYPRRYNHKWKS